MRRSWNSWEIAGPATASVWPARPSARPAMCEDLEEEGACDKLAPLQKRHAEIIRRDWPKSHARDEATTKTRTETKTRASHTPLFVPPGPEFIVWAAAAAAPALPSCPFPFPSASARVASHPQIYLEPARGRPSRPRRRRNRVEQRCDRCRLLFSSPHFFFAAIDPFCALYAHLTRCISRGRVTGYANCKAVSALPATMRELGTCRSAFVFAHDQTPY